MSSRVCESRCECEHVCDSQGTGKARSRQSSILDRTRGKYFLPSKNVFTVDITLLKLDHCMHVCVCARVCTCVHTHKCVHVRCPLEAQASRAVSADSRSSLLRPQQCPWLSPKPAHRTDSPLGLGVGEEAGFWPQ